MILRLHKYSIIVQLNILLAPLTHTAGLGILSSQVQHGDKDSIGFAQYVGCTCNMPSSQETNERQLLQNKESKIHSLITQSRSLEA